MRAIWAAVIIVVIMGLLPARDRYAFNAVVLASFMRTMGHDDDHFGMPAHARAPVLLV